MRTRGYKALATLIACLAISSSCKSSTPAPAEPPADASTFTVVLLPDTQYYASIYRDTYTAQTQWIADQVAALDIKAVVHLGDLTDGNSEAEWKVADRAMALLDGVVPYTVMPGNHDGVRFGRIDSQLFNKYFPPARFEGHAWYGGHMGRTNDNSYIFFDAAGMEFMVVSLSFGTPAEALEWANELIGRHPEKRVILATHAYMDHDGTRLVRGETYAVEHQRWTDGDAIWEGLVKRHRNIFMVVSGHVTGGGYLTSTGDHGNRVHQLLANYQATRDGGQGFLRTLTFSPASDTIYVRAYSPKLDRDLHGKADAFDLPYDMTAP